MAYRNDAGFFFRTFEKIANPGVKIMAEWTEEAKKKNGIKKKRKSTAKLRETRLNLAKNNTASHFMVSSDFRYK